MSHAAVPDRSSGEGNSWLDWKVVSTSLRATQWTFVALRLVLLVGSLFFLTWMASYNALSWDLTENGQYTLSEQTEAVIDALEEPVTLTAFVEKGDNATIERYLLGYADRSALVDYRMVDPEAEPALAESLQVDAYNLVIVAAGDRVQRVEEVTEPHVTNALLAVTRGEAVPICFLAGHGERSTENREREGLSAALGVLEQTNYRVEHLNLLAAGAVVPAHCQVVVVAGPKTDVLPTEADALGRYLDEGGRLVALFETNASLPLLAGVVAEYGLMPNEDLVIDTAKNGSAVGLGIQVPLIDAYDDHPITDNFRLMTLFPSARSINVAAQMPEGVDARVLARTTNSSWGETRFEPGNAARWDEGEDFRGPLALVVAVADSVEETPAAYRERMRRGEPAPLGDPILVAIGDADFASNAYFNWQGNGDLLLNSINWLSGQQELISIRPKEAANKRIELTDGRRLAVFSLLVLLLPMLPAIAGVVMMVKKMK